MESDKSSVDSQLCSNGCGFHGPLQTHNLCSKCFEENEKATVAKSKGEPSSPPPLNPSSSPLKFTNSIPRLSFSSNTTNTFSGFSSSFGPLPKPSNLGSSSIFGVSSNTKRFSFAGNTTSVDSNRRLSVNSFSFGASNSNSKKCIKNRCIICKKRVGLTGFECRCGNLFCGKHRYPEEHSCNFDYKKFGRDLLLKQNPVCKADKLRD